jgi:Lysyl oxidase
MTRLRILALCGLAAAALASVSIAATRPQAGQAEQLLPDLESAAPSQLMTSLDTSTGRTRFLLGFGSAADNIGRGPLVVRGDRPDVGAAEMTASQVIRADDGFETVVPGIGILRYVVDPTHQHWHLLPFMSYELRHADGYRLARPDTKTGFCLGDRYLTDASERLPGEPASAVYRTNCGLGDTGLLVVEEGISVGYGDDYAPWRDGQYLDLTGLPKGRYVLVHRVNKTRVIREMTYANNASSMLISLTWPNGTAKKPRVRVVSVCPNTARCAAR